jgi:hypothetical protein
MPTAPPIGNVAAPMGVSGIDPDSGVAYAIGLANATALTTAGTTTVDATGMGVFYGFNVVSVGTSFTAQAFDVLGTSSLALTGTNTATAVGQSFSPGPIAGVRYGGNLVVVTSGTPGIINTLWD